MTEIDPMTREKFIKQFIKDANNDNSEINKKEREPLDEILDYAIIGACRLARKLMDLEEFTREMVAEFGETVRFFMPGIFAQSQSILDIFADEIEGMNADGQDSIVEIVDKEIIDSEPPFIWPETKILSGHASYLHEVPFHSLLDEGGIIFGIIYDLDQDGVRWLESRLTDEKSFKCKLILALYPACATDNNVLNSLMEWQKHVIEISSGNKLEIRLLPTYLNKGAPSNTLCITNMNEKKSYFLSGASPNFGLNSWGEAQHNFVIPAETRLLSQFIDWFDYTWEMSSIPLNEETACIPPLMPATGTAEGAAVWRDYLAECEKQKITENTKDKSRDRRVSVDENTGAVSVKNASGDELLSATADIEIQRPDELIKKMSQIYKDGLLVSFDKLSRVQPLEVPVKAEWLGMETLRTVGTVTQELRYKISIIDDRTSKEINNKKKLGATILSKMSFPLNTGHHFIPRKAIPFFESELDYINKEGQNRLKLAVNGTAEEFINASQGIVIKDANKIYQEFHPGNEISDETINNILSDLQVRLNKALNGRFIPDVNYYEINISLHNSNAAPIWSQVLAVLYGISKYPRTVLSDNYFMRGLRIEKDKLLEAMDICGDTIIKVRQHSDIVKIAKNEIAFLNAIMDYSPSTEKNQDIINKAKCSAIFELMDGQSFEVIMNKLGTVGSRQERLKE